MATSEKARALALVQDLIRKGQCVIDGRVQPFLEECDLTKDQVFEKILKAGSDRVVTMETDRDYQDKTVLIMNLECYFPHGVYCKVSLRLPEAKNLVLLSFWDWDRRESY